ncbi:MAG TPA: hypothetical protein DEF43_18625 [Chloroflexus aurantiacus]|jgi:hypothetical protein|nr:MAG: hypothetical protein D6716_13635 [Chloroflexota bacterium]HBW69120.1 hypothetical protein [Chloroflexus aurantiacus]
MMVALSQPISQRRNYTFTHFYQQKPQIYCREAFCLNIQKIDYHAKMKTIMGLKRKVRKRYFVWLL